METAREGWRVVTGSNNKNRRVYLREKNKERRGSISRDGSDGQRCGTFLWGHVSLRGQPGAPRPPSPRCIVVRVLLQFVMVSI